MEALREPGWGRGGFVGAGVASPEANITRLPLDRDIGMSASKSGSGGAQKRSEKPAGLTGSLLLCSLLLPGSITGESELFLGAAVTSFCAVSEQSSSSFPSANTGGAGRAGGGRGLGGGAPGRAGGAPGLAGGPGLGGGGLGGAEASGARDRP